MLSDDNSLLARGKVSLTAYGGAGERTEMWKDWWNRLYTANGGPTPDEARSTFERALEEAKAREESSRPLFEQLAFALRIAESPIPIDRATIPLHLSLGPDKVKELAAQIKLSPFLKNNIQALVHHYREDQRELANAERASALLAQEPTLYIRAESVQLLFSLFHFLPASREQFRDYPLFYQLFGGAEFTLDSPLAEVPEDLRFFLSDSPTPGGDAYDPSEDDDLDDGANPEMILNLIEVVPLALEVGLDLVPLIDPVLGGELLGRLGLIRLEVARDLGFVMPGVQFRHALQMRASAYGIRVRGNTVASGELMVGYHLAIETPETDASDHALVGFATTDPALGLPATWVTRAEGQRAAKLGYLVLDCAQVLVRHLDEVVRAHAHELLSLEDVSVMLDRLRERSPQTVDAVVGEKLELADYQLILKNLLRERVSIRDQQTILERLAHAARPVHPFYLADRFGDNKASIENIMLMEISAQIRPLNDPMILTETVRQALSRQICAGLADAHGVLDVVQLAPQVEQVIMDAVQTSATGQTLVLAPGTRDLLVNRLLAELGRLERPVLLCDPRTRPFVKQVTTRALPRLTVLSHAELHPQYRVQSVGTVSLIEN